MRTNPGILDRSGPRKLSPTELGEKLYGGSERIPALKDEMTAMSDKVVRCRSSTYS